MIVTKRKGVCFEEEDSGRNEVSWTEALRVWVRVALMSFGGPAGQISVMHKIIVEEKKWVDEKSFLHALNYCMLLPGPEAQQLATYLGWLMHKVKGGLVAGLLFILPGFVSIMVLSMCYILLGHVPLVQYLFFGLKAAIIAIVIGALVRISSKALRNKFLYGIALFSFVCIYFLNVSFPFIILGAAVLGMVFAGGIGSNQKVDEEQTKPIAKIDRKTVRSSVFIALLFTALWILPICVAWVFRESEPVFFQEGLFFAKAALVTFGGAYSVLAYVAQQAVDVYHWMLPHEMIDGLGMAETTPGPLIQVVQFVGFVGAYRQTVSMDPLLGAIIGSVLVTWVTFIPGFIFVFAGAPFVEAVRGSKLLANALTTITAAVVGVILNLSLWFSLHTLFARVNSYDQKLLHFDYPVLQSLNIGSLCVAAIACIVYFIFKQSMLKTIAISVAIGVIGKVLLIA